MTDIKEPAPLPTAKEQLAAQKDAHRQTDRIARSLPEATDPGATAPSTPDQASAVDKEVAAIQTAPFRGVEGEYADNEIERVTRQMAQDGASAPEIAAKRAELLAKL